MKWREVSGRNRRNRAVMGQPSGLYDSTELNGVGLLKVGWRVRIYVILIRLQSVIYLRNPHRHCWYKNKQSSKFWQNEAARRRKSDWGEISFDFVADFESARPTMPGAMPRSTHTSTHTGRRRQKSKSSALLLIIFCVWPSTVSTWPNRQGRVEVTGRECGGVM